MEPYPIAPPSVVSSTLPLPQPSSLAVTTDSSTTRDSDTHSHYLQIIVNHVLNINFHEQLINHCDLCMCKYNHVILKLTCVLIRHSEYRQSYYAVQAASMTAHNYNIPSRFRSDSYLSSQSQTEASNCSFFSAAHPPPVPQVTGYQYYSQFTIATRPASI